MQKRQYKVNSSKGFKTKYKWKIKGKLVAKYVDAESNYFINYLKFFHIKIESTILKLANEKLNKDLAYC